MTRPPHPPHVFVVALCVGLVSANMARLSLFGAAIGVALVVLAAAAVDDFHGENKYCHNGGMASAPSSRAPDATARSCRGR